MEAALFGSEPLRTADEIFLTSTAGGVMPVTMLEGRPVGDGRPGPLITLLRRRYWEAHDEAPWTTPIDYEVPVGTAGRG